MLADSEELFLTSKFNLLKQLKRIWEAELLYFGMIVTKHCQPDVKIRVCKI